MSRTVQRGLRAQQLDVWMNGTLVGHWASAQGAHEFSYAPSWLESPLARPISLSLPLVPAGDRLSYRGAVVEAFFENLLPDSKAIRERLARRFRAESTAAFDLLMQTGRDCAGALQLVPAGADPGDVRRIDAEPLTEAQVERLLVATVNPLAAGQGDHEDGLRLSIAGAQEKTALLRQGNQWMLPRGATPTTHILKMPMGLVGNLQLDLRESVENEWLCAQILAAYGLPVARCEMARFGSMLTLVVERFDRARSSDARWLLRLPQEDMCQATGTPGLKKYEADGGPGIDRILGLLAASVRPEDDRRDFFKAQLLFWLLCAPDGHAKNFSIRLLTEGRFALTPLYDVLSAYPVLGNGPNQVSPHKVKLAMAVRSTNAHWRMSEVQRRHWSAVAARAGLSSSAESIIAQVLQATETVLGEVEAKLPENFPRALAQAIFSGVRNAASRLSQMPAG